MAVATGWDLERVRGRRDELLAAKLEPPTLDRLFNISVPPDTSYEGLDQLARWGRNEGAKIDAYLSGFVLGLGAGENPADEVEKPGGCPCCYAELGGFLGAFKWGLVHGSGSCSRCSWPVVVYHRLYLDDRGDDQGRLLPEHRDHPGDPDWQFSFMLPVHPYDVLMKDEVRVYQVEVEDPRDRYGNSDHVDTFPELDRAAQEFESEHGTSCWEEAKEELREHHGELEHEDEETGRIVRLRRTLTRKGGDG